MSDAICELASVEGKRPSSQLERTPSRRLECQVSTMTNMRIGEIARETGLSTKTIRYYEDIGVLPEPPRAANGYRDYRPETVDRLLFVRDAQATGLSLTEISSILELREAGRGTCEHVVDLLERHLRDLDQHLKVLRQTRKRLVSLTERARGLNPTDCTDAVRCQTIAVGARTGLASSDLAHHLHHKGTHDS
jgi:MerR family transcriptional regulator, copper efflux regulator